MEQKREPMEKNRIERRERWTSELVAAKSISIKSAERRSGGCAWKAVRLTSGGLRRVRDDGLRGAVRFFERGAGVSRGHSRSASATVQSEGPKGAPQGVNGRGL